MDRTAGRSVGRRGRWYIRSEQHPGNRLNATPDTRRDLLASRYRLISRLADDLAHEIKSPLHAMVINLEVLRRRVTAGDPDIALERAAGTDQEIPRPHQLAALLLTALRP